MSQPARRRPYYDSDGITIFHGDARAVLPELPSDSVDLVVTDAPYGLVYPPRVADGEPAGQEGTPLCWLGPVFQELHRVLKDDRYCVAFYRFSPEPFLAAARGTGLLVVSELPFVRMKWRLGDTYDRKPEVAYLMVKGRPPAPREPFPDAVEWWPDSPTSHPDRRPVAAILQLVQRYSGPDYTVLDPFMGTGSTLVAAYAKYNKAVGIEIDGDYCRQAAEWMKKPEFSIRSALPVYEDGRWY